MSVVRDFQTGAAPTLQIERVAGDLTVQVWSQPYVQAQCGAAADLAAKSDVDTLELTSDDDLLLRVPGGTVLQLEKINGDATVAGVRGGLDIAHVGGDLQLHNVGRTRIGEVNGDLAIRRLTGELTIDAVHGDSTVVGVTGDVRITLVADDLTLHDVGGSIDAKAGDNINAQFTLASGQSYLLDAGDSLTCRIPAESAVTASLRAGSAINIRKLDTPAPQEVNELEFVLGDGGAQLMLTAGNKLTLIGRTQASADDAEFGQNFGGRFGQESAQQLSELAEQLGQQIEVQIEAATRQLDARLSNFDNEEIGNKVQEKVQAALRKVEEKLAHAVRSAEKRPPERPARPPMPPRAAKTPKPAKPTVSAEERMTILRMVEGGKISVAQAEQLLAALGSDTK